MSASKTASRWRRLNARRDHHWVRPRLSDYVEGELASRSDRRLAAHREHCPECEQTVRTLRALLLLLPGLRLPPEASLSIAESIADQVRARISEWD